MMEPRTDTAARAQATISRNARMARHKFAVGGMPEELAGAITRAINFDFNGALIEGPTNPLKRLRF
jgi:hypothetical protein